MTHHRDCCNKIPLDGRMSIESVDILSICQQWRYSTLTKHTIPKRPTRNVNGKKMNVIQLSLHKLALSSND
jgi:hypothetical protein